MREGGRNRVTPEVQKVPSGFTIKEKRQLSDSFQGAEPPGALHRGLQRPCQRDRGYQ